MLPNLRYWHTAGYRESVLLSACGNGSHTKQFELLTPSVLASHLAIHLIRTIFSKQT